MGCRFTLQSTKWPINLRKLYAYQYRSIRFVFRISSVRTRPTKSLSQISSRCEWKEIEMINQDSVRRKITVQSRERFTKKTASLSVLRPTEMIKAQASLAFGLLAQRNGQCTTQPRFRSCDPLQWWMHEPTSLWVLWPIGMVNAQLNLALGLVTHCDFERTIQP